MSKYSLIVATAILLTMLNCESLPGQGYEPSARDLPNATGAAFQAPGGEVAQEQASSSQESGGNLTILNCGVHLIEDIDLPAREEGQLLEVMVREGDMVLRDQMVARIDDLLARRSLEESTFRHQIADQKANDTTEIDSTSKLVEYAKEQFATKQALYYKGSESREKFLEASTNLEIQVLKLSGAKLSKAIATIESKAEMVRVNAAQDSILRHTLVSPVNGVVFEVAKQGSEWVNAGEKVMRIARMDRLKVKGFVDHTRFDPSQILNRRVTVTAKLARDRVVEFSGQIVFVALEKVGTEDFEVWAEVDNRLENEFWQLSPGSNATLTIHLSEPALPPRSLEQLSGPVSNQPSGLGNLNHQK